jgi:Ca2+-binding EF-hand superfamily protein
LCAAVQAGANNTLAQYVTTVQALQSTRRAQESELESNLAEVFELLDRKGDGYVDRQDALR